jgi:hypothetical protein
MHSRAAHGGVRITKAPLFNPGRTGFAAGSTPAIPLPVSVIPSESREFVRLSAPWLARLLDW